MNLKKLTVVSCFAILASVVSGCRANSMMGKFKPPSGLLVTSMKMPLTTEFNETPVKQKKGVASTTYIYDFLLTGLDFAWEDCSIDKAAANGNLTTVEYADVEVFQVFGIFGKTTVTAYGE